MGRLVAVTGATGFVGRRLVDVLAARGWRVRVLARRDPGTGFWACAPEVIGGDLADGAALGRLVAGADLVIHCAGLIKARRKEAFFAVNADGACAVAQAAAGRRLIHVSSLAAREPQLSDYAASKRAGEDLARRLAGDRLTVVRPPAIYGPGDRETFGFFQLAGVSPVLPLPGPAAARLALAHVDDVAAAIADLSEEWRGAGPFAVPGAERRGYSWREIFETAASAIGRRPSFVTVPAWAISAAATLSEVAGAVRGEPSMFTPGKAREVLHPDWSVAPDEEAPGAAPARFSLKEGFTDTVAWYRARGWLR
jgi:nucleoside-diphosphate-sugar epimerase